MRLFRSTRDLGALVLAATLAITCRSYEVVHSGRGTNEGGSPTGGAEHGGDGGAGADDKGGDGPSGDGPGGDGTSGGGASGESGASGGSTGANGGTSGRNTGGTGGSSGEGSSGEPGAGGEPGMGGETGAGTGGESGGGSGPTAEPGIFGAVRVLVGGIPRCGGTLITNDWVMTADRCLMYTDDPKSITIGFGMDASNFQQTRPVIEIRRFPGNDGTDPHRGRDLLLLGVEHPFEIDGRTSGYYRFVWHAGVENLITPHYCVGWDLHGSATSPTSELHEEVITPFTYEKQARTPTGEVLGDQIWWLNTSPDPGQGVLPMTADIGSGCFVPLQGVVALTTVHSQVPPNRRNGEPNDRRESYSVALGEPEVNKWFRTILFEATETTIELDGDPGGCARGRNRLEIFGRVSDGRMGWWTREGGWTEREPLAAPDGTSLSNHAPGAYCTKAGGIELLATDIAGRIWWQRMNSEGQWNTFWEHLSHARTAVQSGIGVGGVLDDHFHLFAVGENQELRYAEYDRAWTGEWRDLGGVVKGTPTIYAPNDGFVVAHVRAPGDDSIWHAWFYDGAFRGWAFDQPAVDSDPASVTWNYHHLELMARSPNGAIRLAVAQSGWSPPIDLDIYMPPGAPIAMAREPGTTDLFLTQPNGHLWHAHYPRKPIPDEP